MKRFAPLGSKLNPGTLNKFKCRGWAVKNHPNVHKSKAQTGPIVYP